MKVYEITETRSNVNEWLPVVGAVVRVAGPWLMKKGAEMLAKRGAGAAAGAATRGGVGQTVRGVGQGIGAAGKGIGIGAVGLTVADVWQTAKQGVEALNDLITNIVGPEVFAQIKNLAMTYSVHILIAVAIFYGGKKLLDIAMQKKEIQEIFNQAKGSDPMPKKHNPTSGPTQQHPLRGKLVGG